MTESNKNKGYILECPKCKAHIDITQIIDGFKGYLERFRDEYLKEIKKKINIDFIINNILDRCKE